MYILGTRIIVGIITRRPMVGIHPRLLKPPIRVNRRFLCIEHLSRSQRLSEQRVHGEKEFAELLNKAK